MLRAGRHIYSRQSYFLSSAAIFRRHFDESGEQNDSRAITGAAAPLQASQVDTPQARYLRHYIYI